MADSPNPNRTKLDQNAIFQRSFDEANDRLRVDSAVSLDFQGELAVELDATDGDTVGVADPVTGLVAGVTNVQGVPALSVNVLNQLETQPSGLSKGLRVTRQIITDVPSAIPSSNLLDRNSMSIRLIGSSNIYFGNSSVNSSTGYPKYQFEELAVDTKDTSFVQLYGVCSPGETCEIAILELA